MPFNIKYNYGQGTKEVQHASVPPQGRTVVSADFVIMYVNNVAIGMVQRFAPTETRGVMPQYEIGNIYPVEMVPSVWSGEIEASRVEIFKDSFFDAFQFNADLNSDKYFLKDYWPSNKRGAQTGLSTPNSTGAGIQGPVITNIADIQWPIDIDVHITNPNPKVNGITIKTYLECWITGYQTSYDAGAKVVAEGVRFMYRNSKITQALPPQITGDAFQGSKGRDALVNGPA